MEASDLPYRQVDADGSFTTRLGVIVQDVTGDTAIINARLEREHQANLASILPLIEELRALGLPGATLQSVPVGMTTEKVWYRRQPRLVPVIEQRVCWYIGLTPAYVFSYGTIFRKMRIDTKGGVSLVSAAGKCSEYHGLEELRPEDVHAIRKRLEELVTENRPQDAQPSHTTPQDAPRS